MAILPKYLPSVGKAGILASGIAFLRMGESLCLTAETQFGAPPTVVIALAMGGAEATWQGAYDKETQRFAVTLRGWERYLNMHLPEPMKLGRVNGNDLILMLHLQQLGAPLAILTYQLSFSGSSDGL